MAHQYKKCLFAFASPLVFSWCFAAEQATETLFFDTLETAFRKQYVECTGDSLRVDIKYIFAWKEQLDEWAKSKECADLRADYKKNVDSAAVPSPCKLRAWALVNKSRQDSREHGVVNGILASDDSIEVEEALKAHPAGAFDFPGIPFGVSRNIFSYLFKKKYSYGLLAKDAFLYVENMPWEGANYLTAFYFDKNDMFYKYEIETPGLPADSLNTVVRPTALHLASVFEQKLGAPRREYRVGYFDIKSKELSPLIKWDAADYSAIIGLSVFKYRYYAKAIVTDAKLPQEPAAGK
jgi:hypothetical protein